MFVKTAIAATTVALAASAAPAASIDLEALGLFKGALIAETDEATVDFFAMTGFLLASGDDGATFGSLTAFLAPTLDVELTLLPTPGGSAYFEGELVEYDVDATHAVGLFYDAARMAYVLGEATAPAGEAFDFSDDFFFTASASLYEVAPIPLPAAAPMLLLGLAGLAAFRRRAA